MSGKVKLGERFKNVVFGSGDNYMRGVWVFIGIIESRGWRCGGVVGIESLGGRRSIIDCDRGRRGGFNSCCCHWSGSYREKRHRWTPMRHSVRGYKVKRQMDGLKRKDGLNKFNMSGCVYKTI